MDSDVGYYEDDLDVSRRDEIAQRYRDGDGMAAIAESLDVDECAVRRVRARRGLDAREQTDAERALDPTIGSDRHVETRPLTAQLSARSTQLRFNGPVDQV